MTKEYLRRYPGTPFGKNSSVHYESTYRLDKAKEELRKQVVRVDDIITHAIQILKKLGVETSGKENIRIQNPCEIDYKRLAEINGLADIRDIVWMKFAANGHLGVVATSNDINFNIPIKTSDYNEKQGSSWKYNTSGILLHQVGLKWDESFVLVFPLKNIPKEYSRGDIERAIGNYLIANNIPIIDFYSHNY